MRCRPATGEAGLIDQSVAQRTETNVGIGNSKLALTFLEGGMQDYYSAHGFPAKGPCGPSEEPFKKLVIDDLNKEDPAIVRGMALEFARQGYMVNSENKKGAFNIDHKGIKGSELDKYIDAENDDGFNKILAKEFKKDFAAEMKPVGGFDAGVFKVGGDTFMSQRAIEQKLAETNATIETHRMQHEKGLANP